MSSEPVPNAQGQRSVFVDDEHLWRRYWAAPSDDERAEAAAAIVERHLPFIRMYARRSAHANWRAKPDVVDEYFRELVAMAMRCVPRWDPTRGASFATFIRRRFADVAWTVDDYAEAVKVSKETRRLRALGEGFIAQAMANEDRVPPVEEVAEYVSLRYGRTVTPRRMASILDRIDRAFSTDLLDGKHADQMAALVDPAPGPEELAMRSETSREVRQALASLNLSAIDVAIVERRLSADDPEPVELVAASLRVDVATVIDAEMRLTEELCLLLCHLRD